jgi:hypothetical protein
VIPVRALPLVSAGPGAMYALCRQEPWRRRSRLRFLDSAGAAGQDAPHMLAVIGNLLAVAVASSLFAGTLRLTKKK